MEALAAILFGVAGASVTALIAKKRGRDPGRWLFIGFILWIVAIPLVLLIKKGDEPTGASIAPNIVIAVIALIGGLVVVNWTNLSPAFIGYDCSNMTADLKSASEHGIGPRLLAIFDGQEISKADDRIECRGTALWSTNMKTSISYQAYKDHDQWFVAYQQL